MEKRDGDEVGKSFRGNREKVRGGEGGEEGKREVREKGKGNSVG